MPSHPKPSVGPTNTTLNVTQHSVPAYRGHQRGCLHAFYGAIRWGGSPSKLKRKSSPSDMMKLRIQRHAYQGMGYDTRGWIEFPEGRQRNYPSGGSQYCGPLNFWLTSILACTLGSAPLRNSWIPMITQLHSPSITHIKACYWVGAACNEKP